MTIKTDRDSRRRAPEREVKRDRQAVLDALARAAWTQGYLYGIGKPNVARALARKRTMEKIRNRRAAQDVARALDRSRMRSLKSIR